MNIAANVVNKNLCISCGACELVCPHNLISFSFEQGAFRPTISDEDKCTGCGLCVKVCPSYGNDLSLNTSENLFAGDALESYVAYSKDTRLRKNSASGGLITNLIISLLEKGHYKKAAVVKYDKFTEQAGYTITDQRQTIVDAAKSKYIPVSTKNVLKYIAAKPSEPIIVVVTPCQRKAIANYCKIKKISTDHILFLGLFCESTLNYNVYRYYKYAYGDYDYMYFRSKHKKGWPGHTLLGFGSKQTLVNRSVRIHLKAMFKNNRCRFCIDKLNQNADICFGDCYIKEHESLKGNSNVVIRTCGGRDAFDSVAEWFECVKVDFSKIVDSQGINKLEQNFARALELNPKMYNNPPRKANCKVDMDKEKNQYSQLKVGANAQSDEDYDAINKKIQYKRNKNKLAYKIKKLLRL